MGARRCIVLCVLALVGASVPAADAQTPVPSRDKPIYVDATAIKRGVIRHWQRAFAFALGDRAGWQHAEHREVASAYLIEQRWIAGEANEMQISVTKKEVAKAFTALRRRQFPRRRDYERYLRRTRLTEQDMLFSIRSELLAQRVTARVVEGAADVHEAQRRIVEYRAARKAKWQPRTTCAPSWRLAEWCA